MLKGELMHIINKFRYIFKSDPCKICLVKPCCNQVCEEKHSWYFYTWHIKDHLNNDDIVAILCGIMYIGAGISALIKYLIIRI